MLSPSVDTLAVALPTHNCACHHHVHENDNTHWHSCPRRTKPLATGHHAIATASPQGSLAGRLVVGRSNCALASGRSAAMGKGQARFKRWWHLRSACDCAIRPSVRPLTTTSPSRLSSPSPGRSKFAERSLFARCSLLIDRPARSNTTKSQSSLEVANYSWVWMQSSRERGRPRVLPRTLLYFRRGVTKHTPACTVLSMFQRRIGVGCFLRIFPMDFIALPRCVFVRPAVFV